MARIYLIRHGKAGSTWDDRDPDPGLSELGQVQAQARAAALAGKGPLPLVTSPLRRTRETAASFERVWNVRADVEPRVGEIPAPETQAAQRIEWLKQILEGRWRDLDSSLKDWRAQVLEAILSIDRDTVVISHYVAINVAVGHAIGDDRVSCFRPENCSCTVLDIQDRSLALVELGTQGTSRVL